MSLEYVNTPFNYTGGKFKILPQIKQHFDYSKNIFVDLFAGGGSVYTNVINDYDTVIVNDIISDLIFIQAGLLTDDKFVERVKCIAPDKSSQEEYLKLREQYNTKKTPEALYALMLSCTNNTMRFNKKFEFNQTFGKRSFNDSTQQKIDNWVKHVRPNLHKIRFSSCNFSDFNSNDVEDKMFYLDPPYGFVDNNGDIGKTQISEAGYNAYWSKENELNLYKFVREIDSKNGSFCISGVLKHGENESWILNKLVKDGFECIEINCDYEKVSRAGNGKNTKEVIIKNY